MVQLAMLPACGSAGEGASYVSEDGETESHVALLVDGDLLWEDTLLIPGPPAFHPIETRLERATDVGAMIVLHVHNHGANSYRWEPVELHAAPMLSSSSRGEAR